MIVCPYPTILGKWPAKFRQLGQSTAKNVVKGLAGDWISQERYCNSATDICD
jgi:hypothetical protein